MGFYEFANNSPWLTFFLFLIVAELIWKSVKAITKYKEEG